MIVSYDLARQVAAEVASRVKVRFPAVRVEVYGPTEMAHGVFVEMKPMDPRAVYVEVFVIYDGSYLLNAGPNFCIESGVPHESPGDLANQIFAEVEAFGTAGLVQVRGFRRPALFIRTWNGRPGVDDYIDKVLSSRFSTVIRTWRPWTSSESA